VVDEVSSFSINNLLPNLISSPHGFIRLPAHFFFDAVGAKKKLSKRNALFVGAAHTRKLLKKFDQNLPQKACAQKVNN